MIRTALKTLFRPEDMVELRGWDKQGATWTARYQYGRALLRMIEFMDGKLKLDCYYVLNPTNLPARDLAIGGVSTWEDNIPLRRWFLLDCDPKRPNKIATEDEYKLALDAAGEAKQWLEYCGYADIVMATSGNGVHLLTPIDLPNTPDSKRMIRHVQRAVSNQFSNPNVVIECFPDANRLVRAYGTLNRKGSESETMKYRRSSIL